MLKTTDEKLLDVEELDTNQAVSLLKSVSPDLARTIDELPSEVKFPFYKANYRFGSQIIDKNGVYLPINSGDSILINDQTLPENLKLGLGYNPSNSNPIGIILNKNCEFYVQDQNKITPYTILRPGGIFGLSKNFNTRSNIYSSFLWDLNAGVKSIFMLAKVSNRPQHFQLKKAYGLTSNLPPSNYVEQWSVFRELVVKTDSSWRAEVLFLDNRWAMLLQDRRYANLQFEMAKANRPGIWHHQPSWDTAFGEIEAKQHLKLYSADILDAARHLFGIAAGSYPGFRPALEEMSAPIKLFQDAYINIYELEHYPIVMEAALLSEDNKHPIFYSLNWPSSPKSVLGKMDNGRSVIVNLFTLMQIVETYQTDLIANSKVRAFSLRDAARSVDFSFYDSDYSKYKGIKDIKLLPTEDNRFACGEKVTFPHHSCFLKGLIKISSKI